MTKKVPTESQEQQRLVLKLRWLHPDVSFFAIPNGGKRGKAEARRMVLEGVEKGTPDIFIAKAMGKYHGLFIELKRAIKTLSSTSEDQIKKHKELNADGYLTIVCYGCDGAYKNILEYLEIDLQY